VTDYKNFDMEKKLTIKWSLNSFVCPSIHSVIHIHSLAMPTARVTTGLSSAHSYRCRLTCTRAASQATMTLGTLCQQQLMNVIRHRRLYRTSDYPVMKPSAALWLDLLWCQLPQLPAINHLCPPRSATNTTIMIHHRKTVLHHFNKILLLSCLLLKNFL